MTKRKRIIDLIEEKWVVVEFNDMIRDILISRFPMTVESGAVIWIDEYSDIEKDDLERQRLFDEINDLMKELWEE